MSVVLGGKWADLEKDNTQLRSELASAKEHCLELTEQLSLARESISGLTATLDASTTEIERYKNTVQESEAKWNETIRLLEEANNELETTKRDCHKLAENLRKQESELEEMQEAKAHNERVAEKLARDLALRDGQLAAAAAALNDKKAMFEKSTMDLQIMKKLNGQKDAKIASLSKEKSRLIERLASSAAKETRSRREGNTKGDVAEDPAVIKAVKAATRRVSAPNKVMNSDVDELGDMKRALADANREINQLRRALVLERQGHEATRRRAAGKSSGDELTPQVLNPWKIHASLLRE